LFTLDERLAQVRDVTRNLGNVRVESFTGLVRDYALAWAGVVPAFARGQRACASA